MSDSSVPIQPAAQTPATALVGIRTFSVLDANGAVVQIQGVCLVDEVGRPIQPLTEATGAALVAAIKALHSDFALMNGTPGPTP